MWMLALACLPFAIARRAKFSQDQAAFDVEESKSFCPPELELPKIGELDLATCPQAQFGTFFVGCHSASGLQKKRFWRDNNALCRVELVDKRSTRESPGGQKLQPVSKRFETPVESGQEPEWKKAFHYSFACLEAAQEMENYVLQVAVKEEFAWMKTHLGYAYISAADFQSFSEVTTKDFDLKGNIAEDGEHRTGSAEGQVKLTLAWCAFGDDECLQAAAGSEGYEVSGSDWTDCRNGCHDHLVPQLHPVYDRARHLMATAVQAGKDEERFDDIEDEFEERAEELEQWLEHHPIEEHMKYFRRPGPPPCPPDHGGEDQPPCPGPPELTEEQVFALLWQDKKRAYEYNERQHEEFKRREEAAEERAKKAFADGKDAMETTAAKLVAAARHACGDVVVPFVEEAGNKIAKMPEGKFKIEKAQDAVNQLDAAWRSILDFQGCLFDRWRNGYLAPSSQAVKADCLRVD
eukprot:CAMPEP_0197655114 /NCGR_PEP_ID=MMETSP1338-20131121/39257_1 /TAXON_ID=43686 ORGANISM="Pelagodinium beii, Strain RCC1491" /NCGR_SAMPLE_ID=MMETSP1338 /ASSEMBLY_ACC=CAM_ASM_000754 /LENGTH=463 /DNA_ID=CAMNT_0043230695 /DNA_START=68 /DNA_END=1459 /DNA_ORIENTATION=-